MDQFAIVRFVLASIINKRNWERDKFGSDFSPLAWGTLLLSPEYPQCT